MPGPDEQTTPETIPSLGELMAPEKLQELGFDRLSQAVAAAAEERRQVKMTNPHYTQRLEAGEAVPQEMRDEPGISLDAAGALRDPWMKNWQNLSVWKRNWHERQAVDGGLETPTTAEATPFTDEELAILEQLGLSDRFREE